MCLIALALQQHPDWPIILIGNRDEFHARASSAASPWEDAPEILGGRDLDAGGTWLAVAPAAGRLGVVTNVREPMPPADALSRGLLVRDYLMGMQSADMYAKGLQAASYRPFNLLLLDDADAIYVTNRPAPDSAPAGWPVWPLQRRAGCALAEDTAVEDPACVMARGRRHQP
nr:NRDE family protein [Hankyongella ginsenosidimutans]